MNDIEKRLASLQLDLDTTWQKLQIDQKIKELKTTIFIRKIGGFFGLIFILKI